MISIGGWKEEGGKMGEQRKISKETNSKKKSPLVALVGISSKR